MPSGSRRHISALALMLMLCAASSAQAQYFGRNKVQYRDFQFEVLKTEHFQIYFYPAERAAVSDLARMAERWYARLSKIFNYDLSSPQPLVVYASGPDFRQTNVISGELGEGTGGVTEGAKRRIVLPLAGTLTETDHVLGHELVHAFQYDMASTSVSNSSPGGGSGIERLPLWFIEGMAEYLSLGHVDPHTAMWIRDAARADAKLPSIGDLNDPRYFPYRWGQSFWAYVAGEYGDAAVETIFAAAVQAGDAQGAIESITGLSEKALSQRWHDAIRAQYAPVLRSAGRAGTFGRLVTPDAKNQRALAVSPVLSPDGSRVVYLSERDMLSIDLFLADATTGKIIRKLVNTAVDPHFSSIQFISSAGTWDPHGKQFAIGAIAQGRPVLAILDVESGRRVREVPFPDLGEILNPSWSPDSRSIAFSATTAGRTDLFVLDLTTGTTRRLTDDAFADLQPAWSPDGRQLAFVTDRYTTDLTLLKAGELQLALLDVASGSTKALPTPAGGKTISPQWAPGGQKLYFLSDAAGITNVYALTLSSNVVSRLTNLDAGASGITAFSPALSAATDANRLAFSAYDNGKIGVYLIEGRDALEGVLTALEIATDTTTAAQKTAAASLPPTKRASTEVATLINDATFGLPELKEAAEPYKAGLSLDSVGQPYVGAGVSRFGATLAGGVSFALSDMLGNHNLFAAVDVNSMGGFSDIYKNTGAVVTYTNLTRRWNWGVSAGQVPYLSGGYATGTTTVNGQPALVEQEVIYRQTHRGANGSVAYPFSPVHRLELGAGLQQVSFDQQVRTTVFGARGGELLSTDNETSPLADPLHLATTTIANVYDTSIAGATSPVSGQRARLELSPTFGSLFVHRRARGLSPLFHAGALLHHCRPRHALRPLWTRRRKRDAVAVVSRIPGADARLHDGFVQRQRVCGQRRGLV